MRARAIIAAAAFVLAFSGVAEAAPVEMDFRDGGYWGSLHSNSSPLTFNEGGVELTVTGHDNRGRDRSIHQNRRGLGVWGGGWDSPQVDGLGRDDVLRFSFNQDVDLLSITFSHVDRNDQATVVIDGSGTVTVLGLGGLGRGMVEVNVQHLDSGSVFDISVRDYNDNFRVAGMSFDDLGMNSSPVPEPATMWLAGAGLAGVVTQQVRRRRRA